MGGRTVLVVGDDSGDVEDALGKAVPDAEVRVLIDPDRLVDVLCRDRIHCLVLPADLPETSGARMACAVRGLYPDLPVVVAGSVDGDVGRLQVTRVDTEDVTDDAVAEAVAASVADGDGTAAARGPSRLETLALSMFDQFPVHLYAKDEAARHVLVSRALVDQTDRAGVTDLDIPGLPAPQREAAYSDDRRVIEDEDVLTDVEEYTDLTDQYVLTSKVPWYDGDGEVVGLAGVTRDITERKRREQALRRQNERLAKVALVAAHELRNELQVANGRLEALDEDESQRDVIAESHARLASIVDDVVGLASSERDTFELRPVWLSTAAREVWDTLGVDDPAVSVDDATLEVRGDARVAADPESLRLFFEAVFRNAVQYAGPDVTVTLGVTDEGFYVADDGPGIDADPPERVLDAGYTTSEESTGFGLYLADSIADDHDWSLTVSEREPGGARFDARDVETPD